MARKNHASLKNTLPEVRKGETLSQRKAFLIACEGICTEPNYILGLVQYEKGNKRIAEGTVVKIAQHQHSDPCGVLNDLLTAPNRDSFDECWIVIDRDEVEYKGNGIGGHTKENFDKAIEGCKNNKVEIACSNPCFELWIVLHFEYRDTQCSRDDIQHKALEKLNTLLSKGKQLKKVDDMKSMTDLYPLLKEKTGVAIKFAEKLSANEERQENPSTGVYKLVKALTSA